MMVPMSRITGRRRTSCMKAARRQVPGRRLREEHDHEMAGDRGAAAASFSTAARYATNVPEKRYLERKMAELGAGKRDHEGG